MGKLFLLVRAEAGSAAPNGCRAECLRRAHEAGERALAAHPHPFEAVIAAEDGCSFTTSQEFLRGHGGKLNRISIRENPTTIRRGILEALGKTYQPGELPEGNVSIRQEMGRLVRYAFAQPDVALLVTGGTELVQAIVDYLQTVCQENGGAGEPIAGIELSPCAVTVVNLTLKRIVSFEEPSSAPVRMASVGPPTTQAAVA